MDQDFIEVCIPKSKFGLVQSLLTFWLNYISKHRILRSHYTKWLQDFKLSSKYEKKRNRRIGSRTIKIIENGLEFQRSCKKNLHHYITAPHQTTAKDEVPWNVLFFMQFYKPIKIKGKTNNGVYLLFIIIIIIIICKEL